MRLRSAAQRAAHTGNPAAGRFLPRSATADAVRIGRMAGVQAAWFGGYEDAERVQVCYHRPDTQPGFTGQWAVIRWHGRFSSPDHRSLLGSLLALGMDRSTLGDLVMGDGAAYLYGLPEILRELPLQWTKAGKDAISVQIMEDAPDIRPEPGAAVRETVSSLRLDAVVAAGLDISRSVAADMIRQGLVMVNHLPEERIDHLLSPGALLSIRGRGRLRLHEALPLNRKQRIPILLEKWVSEK